MNDELHMVMDRTWFERHPKRNYHLRAIIPGEMFDPDPNFNIRAQGHPDVHVIVIRVASAVRLRRPMQLTVPLEQADNDWTLHHFLKKAPWPDPALVKMLPPPMLDPRMTKRQINITAIMSMYYGLRDGEIPFDRSELLIKPEARIYQQARKKWATTPFNHRKIALEETENYIGGLLARGEWPE